MPRIDTRIIYQCIDCSNCDESDGECIISGRTANGHPGDPIPEWCQLERTEGGG